MLKTERLDSVRRISFLLSVVFLASLMTGFFHQPPEVKVKNIKQVVGTYEGTYTLPSGKEIDGITFIIKADGTYLAKTPRGERPGKFRIVDGKIDMTRDNGDKFVGTIRANKEKRILITSGGTGSGEYELVK